MSPDSELLLLKKQATQTGTWASPWTTESELACVTKPQVTHMYINACEALF